MFRIERFKYVIKIVVNMKRDFIAILLVFVIFIGLASYTFAAGGGGGGSSSSGLGFDNRDSILILVSQDYSQKFSLKNGTKYDLKVNVENGKATVNFGNFIIELKNGDNFVDLNSNGLADIDFNLVSLDKNRANVRILDSKELVTLTGEGKNTIKEKTIIQAEKEEAVDDEKELKCSNLNALKERISCRLNLEQEEQEGELKIYYLPEECRSLSGSQRGLCIASYKSVQTCWKFPVGNERISCVKRVIKLENLQQQKEICNSKAVDEKAQCKKELKDKGYSLIKWHFYDLEERAENLMLRGHIDKDTVVDFISKTEQNKISFNDAKTKEKRLGIILAVKNDWKEFADKVREKLR